MTKALHPDLCAAFSLEGRTAVVTGAASGIGRETAFVLAQAGADIVLADLDENGMAQSAARVTDLGRKTIIHRTDMTKRVQVDALAEIAMKEFGRLDIWVNAAGIILTAAILDAADDQIDRVIDVNLKGVYAGTAAAGRAMRAAGRGSIINISSGGGESAVPGLAIYSLTKAAVNMLTRTTAKELGAFGIRANAVAPGWIDTPMGCHGFRDENGATNAALREEGIALRAQASPLGLTGVPRDVALAVLYLASDASRFVTGQIIRPNGGSAMP